MRVEIICEQRSCRNRVQCGSLDPRIHSITFKTHCCTVMEPNPFVDSLCVCPKSNAAVKLPADHYRPNTGQLHKRRHIRAAPCTSTRGVARRKKWGGHIRDAGVDEGVKVRGAKSGAELRPVASQNDWGPLDILILGGPSPRAVTLMLV